MKLIIILFLIDAAYALVWAVFGPRLSGDGFLKRFAWAAASPVLFLLLLGQIAWRAKFKS